MKDSMKILFLTCNGVEDAAFGGAKASIRNFETLKDLGDVEVITVKKRSNMANVKAMLCGYFPPVDGKILNQVKQKIQEKKVDLLFLDGSYFGSIAKYAKNKNIPVISFFHNCEYDYLDVRFGNKKSLQEFLYKRLVKRQEGMAARQSDVNIVFTKRDQQRIATLYNVKNPEIIPLTLKDSFSKTSIKEENSKKETTQEENTVLLFGPLGQANEEAFRFFVTEISPKISAKTMVAGKGFEAYKDTWSSDKVEVIGFVDDIQKLYESASLVAIPLLSGGGMKIKTAEAMMFGKYVFGTEEAFVGYEFDPREIGAECNTAQEFIEEINTFFEQNPPKYCKRARELFEERYSLNASKTAFQTIVNELIK